jgi:hypothetical protein
LGRHFRTVLVLVLLAATAAAFVVTEDLKLEPDPLALPRVDPTFSPVCRCEQQPSHALLVVNGRRVWRTALRAEGVIPWRPGRLRPGLERLQLVAVDAAGNRAAGRPFYIRVRYLEVTPSRLRVRPRRLITVRVSTDYPRYTWRLGRRRSSARAHTLRVRAPATPGRYALTISAGGRRQTTSVLVRRPR